MTKKFISAILSIFIMCTSFSAVSFAQEENSMPEESVDFIIPDEREPIETVADGETPEDFVPVSEGEYEMYDPEKEYEVGDVVCFSDGEAGLNASMTATYKGKCFRKWKNNSGYATNLYQNVTDTSRTTWASNGQEIWTEEIWYTSTGVYRYKTLNNWHNPSGTIEYGQMFVENQNMTHTSTEHTRTGYSVHYSGGHYKVCDYCGNYGSLVYRSDCYSCNPAHIVYYGTDNVHLETINVYSSASVTLNGPVPSKFGYKFLGWNTTTTATSPYYYPGGYVSLSTGQALYLYPVWESAAVISTTTSSSKTTALNARGAIGYFTFTPEETASYAFESTIQISFSDTVGYVYDQSGKELAFNDNYNTSNGDFRIIYPFEEGKTYYLAAKYKDANATGNLPVKLRRQHNITFDANGGSDAPSPQTKLYGDALTLTEEIPYKKGMQCSGWALTPDAEDADYLPGSEFSVEGDVTLYAVWEAPTGDCGKNASWLYKNNTLYISGVGDMYDYTATESAPWSDCADEIKKIIINEGIISVGDYAFSSCSKITSLNLPESVDSIGEYAFNGCSSLEEITMGDYITEIKNYTFNECTHLTSIELPENLTKIGDYAFFSCSALPVMVIPETVSHIGAYAFAECTNLQSINIPSGITVIMERTFENCALKEVNIPGTVKTIEKYAFSKCASLQEIVIPNGTEEIQSAAFSFCSSLSKITIPESVVTIGTSIFAYVTDTVTVKCYLDTVVYNYVKDEGIAYELIPWGILEKPLFSKTDIEGGIEVSVSAEKGTVYYTTNGTEPTLSSKVYTAPIKATKNMTIKAIAVMEGWDNSPVSEYYTDIEKVSSPTANIQTGSKVSKGTKIELFCDTEGAEIWCTTDQSVPTATDVYTEPIEINENTVIYAVAVKNGMLNSSLITLTYNISVAEDTPIVVTEDATDITDCSARVSCQVQDNGGVIGAVEFVYYEKNNSSVKYTQEATSENSAVLTGLSPDTEYWYQAKALNEKGWSYGYIKFFRTNAEGVIKPTSIDIEPGYISLREGQKKVLLATILPVTADSRDVYWSSEDPEVASVDRMGIVTAKGLGNTRIKAITASNRLVAYCNVDVISTKVTGDFNFSEHNMITNSSNYDEHGFDHSVNAGGNALMASAYLARWDGVVLEENDAYPDSPSKIKYKELDPDYHVQNIIYLPFRKESLDNNEIKNAIMKYGAVYTSFKVNYNYFDAARKNYYFPDNVNKFDGGHAIAIVGWDDNYSKANFPVTPKGNGAFICKNSWGTESGENGYFYISYYDKFIARPNCGDYNAVFYEVESNDNYNKIYQYDYLGPVSAESMGSRVLYTANAFPEEGKTLSENETLKAISFYTYSPGTPYEVYIVTDFTSVESLRYLGSPAATGVMEYAGYYTVKLDKPVELKAGTRFAVVVKQTGATSNATVFLELPAYLNSGSVSHSSNARANRGESFIGMDTKTWTDLTTFRPNANVCIKAFTETDSDAMKIQAIDNLGRSYEDDTVCSVEELIDDGMIFNSDYVDYYGDEIALLSEEEESVFGSAPPSILPDLNTNNNYSEGSALPAKYDLREEDSVTSVKNQGDIGSCWSFATYASLESAMKKLSFASNSFTADGLNQAAGDASSVELNTTGAVIALGNILQLKATLLPFDCKSEIVWKSSNSSVVSVSSFGLVRAVGVGNAYITASTADGKASAQCAIEVTSPEKVSSIQINNSEETIKTGNKVLIDYSVYPENAGEQTILWEVDDDSVATIDSYGILSAKQKGTVTVTAYSADRSVSDSYTFNVDDGCDCETSLTSSSLKIYDKNIFGNITADIFNKTTSPFEACVALAIYDSSNKLVMIEKAEPTLSSGNNTVSFNDIYVSGISDSQLEARIFVWKRGNFASPLAMVKSTEIK